MTMISNTFASLQPDAAKPVKSSRQSKSKPKGGRKAGKTKSARQKASQSDRKASRSFKLSPEALKELRAESKGFINPYRESSSYHACVAALHKLGVGSFHAFDKIVAAVELPSGFKSKEKRNQETGKGWKDRITQNVHVVARRDYGAKLRQVGYEVRTDSEKGAGLFKLGSK